MICEAALEPCAVRSSGIGVFPLARKLRVPQTPVLRSVPKLQTSPNHRGPVPQHIRGPIVFPLSMSCSPGAELARRAGVVREGLAADLFLGDPGDWKVGTYDIHPEWAALQVSHSYPSAACYSGRADCTPLCSSTPDESQSVVRVTVHEAIGATRRPPPSLFDGDFLRRFSVHLEVSLDRAAKAGAECVPWSVAWDADFTVVDEDYTYLPDTLCPCHGPMPPPPSVGPIAPPAPRYRSRPVPTHDRSVQAVSRPRRPSASMARCGTSRPAPTSYLERR
ncbi:MAG: hypothetical protein DRI90_07965 [Deltaproteobacteria bacterium]|nr:MAG: hypothetical protein DRI90_07965 [Deltaproteobacteria bacterium]